MRKIMLLFTALAITMQVTAAPVDVTTARATAQEFTIGQSHSARRAAPASTSDIKLVYTELNTAHADQALFYIFNTDDSYIIVAGDDRAQDVLAYGDTPFDVNDIPDGMRYWLDCYKQELEYLQNHPDLVVEKTSRRAPARQGESVQPLLTALWGQGGPYNYQCPTSNGQRCVTGCPATSLTMVFYYWKYPTGPTPVVPGYVTSSLHLYLPDLPSTTFDWDNMLDVYRGGYSSAQANAVAALMRYVGQAEEMDYTPEASGSYGENILETVKFFGYDQDAQLVYKTRWNGTENYTNEEWAQIMQDELFAGRPMVMCAYANSMTGLSGHAFNVDGYDGEQDMYHVNWGWNGSSNGYFVLNSFRGSSMTFNMVQQLIIGIEPPATGPKIKVSSPRVKLSSFVDCKTSSSLTIKGALLNSPVELSLDDENGVFSIDSERLYPGELTSGKRLSVSYTPTSTGTHTAILTLKSNGAQDVKITLTGTAILETYDPVMLDITSDGNSSIQASWNDRTPKHNVSSYTLEVAKKPYSELSLQEQISSANASWSGTSDCSSHLDEITANPGWSGSRVYLGENYLRLGTNNAKGWLETPALDMRDGKGWITVKVTATSTGADSSSPLKVSCGDHDSIVTLTPEAAEYCILLPCPAEQGVKLKLTNGITGKRVLIHSIQVLTGDDASPIDTSTAFYIENITGTSYTLSGLTPDTYAICVQAVYTDGGRSAWSNRTDMAVKGEIGDVNLDGEINIADVNAIVDVMLAGHPSRRTTTNCDINGDGEITIGDINMVIDKILAGL